MKNDPCIRLGMRIRPKMSEKPAESRNSKPPRAMLFTARVSHRLIEIFALGHLPAKRTSLCGGKCGQSYEWEFVPIKGNDCDRHRDRHLHPEPPKTLLLQPNRRLLEFDEFNRPKSATSDFGWKGEGNQVEGHAHERLL